MHFAQILRLYNADILLSRFISKEIVTKKQFKSQSPFHISGVHRSGSRHSWVSFYSGRTETTTNIIFLFLFVPISKEEKNPR